MHLAESAAWAIVLSAREKVAPANVNLDRLQRRLVERGVMICFFNDFDMGCPEPWVPAVQYWAARGFFSSYDARPHEVLDAATAAAWARVAGVTADSLAGLTRGAACVRCYEKR